MPLYATLQYKQQNNRIFFVINKPSTTETIGSFCYVYLEAARERGGNFFSFFDIISQGSSIYAFSLYYLLINLLLFFFLLQVSQCLNRSTYGVHIVQ